MLNQRLTAAKAVATALFPTEKMIEDAIVGNARLAIAIIEGRQSARLPISAGQESLAAVAGVQAALVEARLQIGAAHAALAEDKIRVGLGERAMGDWGECPEVKGAQGMPQTAPLRVVA